MGKIVGAIVAVLAGVALATGVTVGVTSAASPDKAVDLEAPAPANGSNGIVNYGTP